ncbi:MAG: hypothetical protein ACRD1J_07625, partial [Terriglobia bacterium]
ALGYAASQSNILGVTGLLYPFKSGAFRGLMDLSKTFEDIVPEASLVYATADALYTSGTAARNGECQ